MLQSEVDFNASIVNVGEGFWRLENAPAYVVIYNFKHNVESNTCKGQIKYIYARVAIFCFT